MKLRIRTLRKALGLSGEQFGEKVGVSKGYISELETGKKTPGAALLMRMADALNAEVHELFEGSEEDRKSAELKAHMEIMSQLAEDRRRSVQLAAQGLLASQIVSDEK